MDISKLKPKDGKVKIQKCFSSFLNGDKDQLNICCKKAMIKFILQHVDDRCYTWDNGVDHVLLSKIPVQYTGTMLNDEQRKRFLRDTGIPVKFSIYKSSDLFLHAVDVLDDQFNTKQLFQWFLDVMTAECGRVNYFSDLSSKFYHEIICSSVYNEIFEMTLDDFSLMYPRRHNWGSSNIYMEENHEKYFISVDFKSANFTMLKLLNPELVKGFDTWDELIASMTIPTNKEIDLTTSEAHYLYIKNCKELRMILLGFKIVDKVRHLWNYYLENIYEILSADISENFYGVNGDELIFQFPDFQTMESNYHKILITTSSEISYPLNIEPFQVQFISSDVVSYFIRKLFTGFENEFDHEDKIKAPTNYIFAVRHYENMPIVEMDTQICRQ